MQKNETVDYRNELVNRFKMMMLSNEIRDADKVANMLTVLLDEYEFTERTTELAVFDDSDIGILNAFCNSLIVEGRSANTVKLYGMQMKRLLEGCGRHIVDITSWDIKAFLGKTKCGTNGRKPVKDITLLNMQRCYSSFFGWCVKNDILDKNPMNKVETVKTKKEVKKAFSKVEMDSLYNACDNSCERALLHFLYATGCRASEVEKIKISDVDFYAKSIVILGKGNKERRVYLSDVALKYLNIYLDERNYDTDLLFCGRGASPMNKASVEYRVKLIGERAGVENVHPHRVRRTLATDMLKSGVDILTISKLLGHSNIAVTQKYLQLTDSDVAITYQKFVA